MTREELLSAAGNIRDDFIREAAPPAAASRKRREFPWAGAVAACLALMIVGSAFFLYYLGMGGGRWVMRDRILADPRLEASRGDVYARRWLVDPSTGDPLRTIDRQRYRDGYGASLPVFVYIR